MELRSVAYNPTQAPGMQGMQGMPEMMPGMHGMHGMHGMQMAPGMYPPAGMVNLDVDADPGCASYDVGGPMPCSPCGHHHHHPCPMPTPCPENIVYVVKKGDTVYKIAKRYGTTMEAIISANNLRNPDLIYPGQILLIPTGSTGEFRG
jgi:FOG: LysM repeat